MKLLFLAGMVTTAILAAACGSSNAQSDGQPQRDDATADDRGATPTTTGAAPPIPTGVVDSYVGCMADLGYDLTSPEGIVMPDGTVWKEPAIGVLSPLPPVALRNAEFECRAKSGLDGAAAAAGYADDPPDEETVAALNKQMVASVECLTRRGWDVPAPVLDLQFGLLVNEFTPEPADRAAYDLDFGQCFAEAANASQ
jgi:hypothetical protein